MRYAIVSCSLHPHSKSRVLAGLAFEQLRALGCAVELIDLRDLDLPLCDGTTSSAHPAVVEIRARLTGVDGFLLAVPIYNYDVNAACKNFIELGSRDVWTRKVIGFICAAGGPGSYMSVMALASSLMLDFRAYVVPRFVYGVRADFGTELHPDLLARLEDLVREHVAVTEAIRPTLASLPS